MLWSYHHSGKSGNLSVVLIDRWWSTEVGTIKELAVQLLSHVQLFATQELWHTRLPCPSWYPWVCSHSCPFGQWYHPTISPSVTSFFSCPQPFPAPGFFPVSQLCTLGGQSTGAAQKRWHFFLPGSKCGQILALGNKGGKLFIHSAAFSKPSIFRGFLWL